MASGVAQTAAAMASISAWLRLMASPTDCPFVDDEPAAMADEETNQAAPANTLAVDTDEPSPDSVTAPPASAPELPAAAA